MSKQSPDYQDAKLVLELYNLRRETVMRESRNKMNGEFWPRNYDEFLAITDMKHPMNLAFRQTSSYWEMAYSFARHGICNSDFLAENAGEGIFFYAKVRPYVEQFRKGTSSPTAFQNVEWLCNNSEFARKRLQLLEGRVKNYIEKGSF